MTLFGFFVFVTTINAFAQNGRPAKIPTTTIKNSNTSDVTIGERLAALEKAVKSLQEENADLKKQVTALNSNSIGTASALLQLSKKFDYQVGTFKLRGYIPTYKFTFKKEEKDLPGPILTGLPF